MFWVSFSLSCVMNWTARARMLPLFFSQPGTILASSLIPSLIVSRRRRSTSLWLSLRTLCHSSDPTEGFAILGFNDAEGEPSELGQPSFLAHHPTRSVVAVPAVEFAAEMTVLLSAVWSLCDIVPWQLPRCRSRSAPHLRFGFVPGGALVAVHALVVATARARAHADVGDVDWTLGVPHVPLGLLLSRYRSRRRAVQVHPPDSCFRWRHRPPCGSIAARSHYLPSWKWRVEDACQAYPASRASFWLLR